MILQPLRSCYTSLSSSVSIYGRTWPRFQESKCQKKKCGICLPWVQGGWQDVSNLRSPFWAGSIKTFSLGKNRTEATCRFWTMKFWEPKEQPGVVEIDCWCRNQWWWCGPTRRSWNCVESPEEILIGLVGGSCVLNPIFSKSIALFFFSVIPAPKQPLTTKKPQRSSSWRSTNPINKSYPRSFLFALQMCISPSVIVVASSWQALKSKA